VAPSADESLAAELQRLRCERDLYLRMLNLGAESNVRAFLEEALRLIVEVTQAWQGYLELRDPEDDADAPCWFSLGCSREEVDGIRACISRGIIAESIATGMTVATTSASQDPRFADRESVQVGRIGPVLCAPIGSHPPIGVIYLQGSSLPRSPTEEDRARLELFARHIAPFAERLLSRRRLETRDDTRPLRERYRLGTVVGRSKVLAKVLEEAMLAAPLDVNVLLVGESGTGKGQLARAIHENSRRAAGPFVEVNCAALPSTLIESELFGAVPGAHSEARRPLPGKVAAAEGGTLFLDEIAELPFEAQAKLLQLLQSRSYYPLGASTPRHANVRLIAATNANLEAAVSERRFRQDLFYRLLVLTIRLPTLAERKEDLSDLSRALAERACQRHGLPSLQVSTTALSAIEARVWPGNVRQLEHAIEAAAIRAAGRGSLTIAPDHLFPEQQHAVEAAESSATFQEATRRFQRELLQRALAECGWNVTEAARRLDLTRAHVYNLIRAFGLVRDAANAAADKGASQVIGRVAEKTQ
jgi:Nif-specific regulatory protein